MCLQGKSPGSTASPQSVFQVTGSRPNPIALLALSLTDPTLLSSCSSALLNSALLWMAATASGCSCLMAWQASLGRRETEGRAGLRQGVKQSGVPTSPKPAGLCDPQLEVPGPQQKSPRVMSKAPVASCSSENSGSCAQPCEETQGHSCLEASPEGDPKTSCCSRPKTFPLTWLKQPPTRHLLFPKPHLAHFLVYQGCGYCLSGTSVCGVEDGC